MKFRRTRVLIALLFVVWIGGMLMFFSGNGSGEIEPMSKSEREEHIKRGKESRQLDHINKNHHEDEHVERKEAVAALQHPKVRNKVIPKEETDTRSLAAFDWRGYIKRSGLKPGEDKNQRNAYNQEASDALAWDRTVPDVQDAKCQNIKYDKDLPTTSIIICFHSEGRAALLRTIVSVLNRSPPHLVTEIILVDDFS